MALKTTLEQLEEVQAAITQCLAAQQMGAGDKQVQRARLDQLQAREEYLLRRYNETAAPGAGGMFNKVKFYDAS